MRFDRLIKKKLSLNFGNELPRVFSTLIIYGFCCCCCLITEVWHDHTFHTTVSGSQVNGTVTGLRPAMSYQFRIFAENELGRSQASDVGICRLSEWCVHVRASSLAGRTAPASKLLFGPDRQSSIPSPPNRFIDDRSELYLSLSYVFIYFSAIPR